MVEYTSLMSDIGSSGDFFPRDREPHSLWKRLEEGYSGWPAHDWDLAFETSSVGGLSTPDTSRPFAATVEGIKESEQRVRSWVEG